MSRLCRGNTQRLVALLTGSLGPRAADRLRQHLARCPGCEAAFARLQRTSQLCRELGAEPAPDLPWRQIEAQVQWRLSRPEGESAPRRAPAPTGWRLLPTLAALAAAAVLGGVAGALFFGHGRAPVGAAPRTMAPRPAARPAAPVDEELAALVTVAQGDVSVTAPRGVARPLHAARPLLQGDRLLTGSNGRLALQWARGSGVLLLPETEVELRTLRRATQELALWQGRLYAQIARRAPDERFAIVAGGLRAAVKGTHFSVAVGPDTVEVEVFEGTVHVEPLQGGWPGVDVTPGRALRLPVDGQRPGTFAPALGAATTTLMNLQPWPGLARVMAHTSFLSLESEPLGADVRFDQQPVGLTNLTLRGSVGRHLVELWRDGKLLRRQWVELQATPGRVALDLRPRPQPKREQRLPEGFHEVFRLRAIQIQACYERRLKANPALEGKLTLRINVDAEGHVAHAVVDSDTFDDPSVGQCAVAAIQRWPFPPGKATQVVYPFQFRPR